MTSVIIFGPTGQVGSVAARTAGELRAKVWLAMRDISKSIPGLTKESESTGDYHRTQADLEKPKTVSQAIKTSGAKRAFIYLVHHTSDHLRGAITAMKKTGINFVVFLSSFTISVNQGLRKIPPDDLIPYVHAQVEANLDDIFSSNHYIAVRPGCFITNLLSEKAGIAANNVRLYGANFPQDNIIPSDISRVVGNIVVSGSKNGQKKVIPLWTRDTFKILGPKEGYNKYINSGMPQVFADYIVKVMGTKGVDKGSGECFPNYQEGVSNMKLYTGQKSTSLEEWVTQNKTIFDA
ncbi:uncharacterized protein yc1106_03731 [Curvularia clavata]|uniref:NAD(P)-binding domain-containing protein n=1 Tax=Curvularia clavata TaxID=95742 RepID=A0A9Q8Z6B5_CURCL|nr:uncharacterized protein yc1106_03731 [Curvularia clavata]